MYDKIEFYTIGFFNRYTSKNILYNARMANMKHLKLQKFNLK